MVDDDLHETECDMICGVYRIDKGGGEANQMHGSWWPKQSTWETSGFGIGQWTPDAEGWYQDRLGEINGGTARLLGAREWTQKLRYQHSLIKRVNDNYERLAERHLQSLP
ncbi:hypothetical protein BD779DRAFT_1463887 [Infundibulicybe gibba]|nr:hypothetical protein BD779DRAFT_1463887 [Infundibulicybe gibba]